MTARDLVLCGYAGEAGMLMIAERKRAEIERMFRPDAAERFHMEKTRRLSPEAYRAAGASEVYPVSEGGVLAAVYSAAKERRCGVRLRLKDIPLRRETVELCEMLRLDPYRLFSACDLLIAENGKRLEEALAAAGTPAALIGYLTGGQDKVIIDKTETEYLNRPEQDELRKVPGM